MKYYRKKLNEFLVDSYDNLDDEDLLKSAQSEIEEIVSKSTISSLFKELHEYFENSLGYLVQMEEIENLEVNDINDPREYHEKLKTHRSICSSLYTYISQLLDVVDNHDSSTKYFIQYDIFSNVNKFRLVRETTEFNLPCKVVVFELLKHSNTNYYEDDEFEKKLASKNQTIRRYYNAFVSLSGEISRYKNFYSRSFPLTDVMLLQFIFLRLLALSAVYKDYYNNRYDAKKEFVYKVVETSIDSIINEVKADITYFPLPSKREKDTTINEDFIKGYDDLTDNDVHDDFDNMLKQQGDDFVMEELESAFCRSSYIDKVNEISNKYLHKIENRISKIDTPYKVIDLDYLHSRTTSTIYHLYSTIAYIIDDVYKRKKGYDSIGDLIEGLLYETSIRRMSYWRFTQEIIRIAGINAKSKIRSRNPEFRLNYLENVKAEFDKYYKVVYSKVFDSVKNTLKDIKRNIA